MGNDLQVVDIFLCQKEGEGWGGVQLARYGTRNNFYVQVPLTSVTM